jgi:YVTN family beta-propeller protein
LAALLSAALSATPPAARATFVNFESQQIHPVALAADRSRLFAVNTPDHRLAVFDLTDDDPPALAFEVAVGLEPVTVAVETPNRVWVVNHLGDSISIVDLTTRNVVATVRTGDEPTDVLFTPDPGSPGQKWAWVCVSAEDRIQVFDAETPAAPLHVLDLFGSDPRTLAYDPVHNRVYAAAFESGNATTIVPRASVHDPQSPWGGELPPFVPPLNPNLSWVPDNGVIVQWNGTSWRDEQGGDWTPLVPWRLADQDVFRIDVTASPAITGTVTGVGTLLFDIAVAPGSGDVFVTNTEAQNQIFFEPKLKGQFIRNRITRIPAGTGAASPVHLNPHVNYGGPGDPGERAQSLSQPGAMAIRSDGQQIFVTAVGSAVLGVLNGLGQIQERRPLAEGATGIVLDEPRDLLYIVNRFTNRIHLMRAASGALLGEVPIGLTGWDPTPAVIRNGRRFLYAGELSAHGDASCASCHAFAGFDNLSWDLGNPTTEIQPPPPPDENGGVEVNGFHPLKGPMTTQTLRGLAGTGFLHWRGDRRDFNAFNPAFVKLMGAQDTLSASHMQAYTDFILTVAYPPNPRVKLDNTLAVDPPGGNAAQGRTLFEGLACTLCHEFPAGTNGFIVPRDSMPSMGMQVMKVPQLRNLYEKTGFTPDKGGGIVERGFGYTHDGSVPTIFDFLGGNPMPGDRQFHLEAFLMSFPTGMAAAVGHQVTMNPLTLGNGGLVAEIAIMEGQAAAGAIDLIVKGRRKSEERGFVYDGAAGAYRSDREADPPLTRAALLAGVGAGAELTWLGVPPLTGERMGIDRDEDGFRDRDELDLGSNPADPGSIPVAVADPGSTSPAVAHTGFVSIAPNPFNPATTIRFALAREGLAVVGVYDVAGRQVRLIAHAVLPAGEHQVRWDGRGDDGRTAASGTYFVALKTKSGVESKKVVLTK